MTYADLIAQALKGRSVNKAAQDWGIPQQTLDRYVKGKTMPDYQTALVISRDAGVEAGTVMRICAEEESRKKPRGMFAELGYATAAIFVGVNLFLTPSPAEAAPVLNRVASELCVM